MADDRNIAQSAIEVLKNLRGSGAPLAARTNDIINNLLGPHLRASIAPVVALADVASMGADIRDTMEFSGDTVDSLRAGDYGKAAIDALYTAAAPLGIVLPGSVGMYRKGAEEVADGLLGMVDDVDPTMPRRLMPNEMRVFQGGPNLYGPDVPGTKPGLDSSKIGTGEGAQVYGHGHYLAENPDVGRGYKTSTSYADIKRKFLSELPQDADFDEAIDLAESGAFGDSGKRFIEALAADDWLGFDYPSQAISAALGKNIDNWDPSAALTKARENLGHLYEYDLPDETIAKMLDWDKPLSEQPGYVYEALRKGGLLADDASLESTRFDLPTDEASRMARAREMGRTAEGYHGTDADISEFGGPTWITDDPEVGSYYAQRARARTAMSDAADDTGLEVMDVDEVNPFDVAEAVDPTGKNVMPLKYDQGKQLDMTSLGDAPAPEELIEFLVERGIIKRPDDIGDWLNELTVDQPTLWKAIEDWGLDRDIKNAGYDSLKIKDIVSAKKGTIGQDSVLVFDPKNIRSRFAKFDPAKAGSADILAGLGVVGAGAALSQQDGFDYGALRNVAEGSNGQLARRGD
jgi:hypothetical protein